MRRCALCGKRKCESELIGSLCGRCDHIQGSVILVQMPESDATHAAGLRAWQQLGRRVKKGEHGIAILAPVLWRQKPRQQSGDEEEDGDKVVSTFETAYVFEIEQTEGKPLPDFTRVGGDPGVYLERLEQFIPEGGIKLERGGLRVAEGVSIGGKSSDCRDHGSAGS